MTSESRDALKAQHQKGVVGALLQPALSEPYYSPRPVSRVGVSDKASEYLERNRGSLSLFLDEKKNTAYQSPRQSRGIRLTEEDDADVIERNRGEKMGKTLDVDANQNYYSARGARVASATGRQIAKNSYGTIGGILRVDDNRGYQTARTQPRLLSDDAKANAAKSTGQVMQNMMNRDANRGYESSRPTPKLPTSETDRNAEKNRGGMSGVLDHSQKFLEPPPAPRVKPEASDIARASQGTCHQVLAGQVPGDPVCDARVKYEGKNVYEKSRGTLTQLQSNYGNHPVSSRPEQRVKGQGAEIAMQGRGSVHNLFQQYGKLPKSAKPRMRPESRKYARRNEGSMASCLNPRRSSFG